MYLHGPYKGTLPSEVTVISRYRQCGSLGPFSPLYGINTKFGRESIKTLPVSFSSVILSGSRS